MELKIYLVRNRITFGEFCQLLGCSRMHLNDIANGKRKCSKTLALLIEAKTNGEVKAEQVIADYKGR